MVASKVTTGNTVEKMIVVLELKPPFAPLLPLVDDAVDAEVTELTDINEGCACYQFKLVR